MKVLYVGKYYAPQIGGIETVTETLCRELSARGVEVVCMVHHHHKWQKNIDLQQNLTVVKKWQAGSFMSVPLSVWTSEEINIYQPDIVHFHLPNPLPLFSLKNIKAKKVATYHCDIVGKGLPGGMYKAIYKKQLQQFDRIILTSRHLKMSSYFKKFELDSERINVVNLAVGLPKNIYKQKNEIKNIVFSGRFVKYKGVLHLLAAIKDLNVKLTLIGDGPEKPSYLKYIKKHSLNDKVKIISTMNKKDLYSELIKHDLFVLPSVNEAEAFGMSALEAMSLGLPVITTDLETGVKELNQHQKTGLVVRAGSVDDLREAIVFVMSDKKTHQEMSKQARQRVCRLFTQDVMIDRYLEIYKSL